MVSTGYNYVGFGAAISSSGKRYYAGVFAKRPDHTAPSSKFGKISLKKVDSHHKRVTVRWSGADPKLQVLTSGLSRFDVQWRRGDGAWHVWANTASTSRSKTLVRGAVYQFRVRARDHAGNKGGWRMVTVRP